MKFYQNYEDGIKEKSVKKYHQEWNVNFSEMSGRFPTFSGGALWERVFLRVLKISHHVNRNGKTIVQHAQTGIQKYIYSVQMYSIEDKLQLSVWKKSCQKLARGWKWFFCSFTAEKGENIVYNVDS